MGYVPFTTKFEEKNLKAGAEYNKEWENEKMKEWKNMEEVKETKRKRVSRRKLTPEENRALNVAMPAMNKSIEAFRRNKGAFIVNDPTFLHT